MSSRDSASDVLMAFLIRRGHGRRPGPPLRARSGEETRSWGGADLGRGARRGPPRSRRGDRGREIGERAVDRGRKLVDEASQTVSRQADRVAEGLDKTARTMKEIRDR